MSATGVKLVVTIGVETARDMKWRERPTRPDKGEFKVSVLVARRLTRSMANSFAAILKREVMRRGFKPLKGYMEIRT
jgi:hypothetical protein